jgi:glyoxylase-like metal-dependent hydrolase (beta-lactamase superfamily II)
MGGSWGARAAALVLIATPCAAQPPPDPVVRVEGLKQVSPHVQVIPDNSVPVVPNVGFVVGTKAVLVIDTGLGPPNGAAVAAVAQRLAAGKPIYLVTTHVHPEHDLGAQAFPATTRMIRSTDQQAQIASGGLAMAKSFAARTPAMGQMLEGAQFRAADISYSGSYDLDLGGVTAQILALGPNHTPGDTGVWVAADKVLFSGDVAMKPQPSFAGPGSTVGHWLGALDRLEALKPAIVVPSHGPIGDVGLITGYRAYLTEVRTRTAAEKAAGRTADEAQASVLAAMGDRYPDKGRLAGAVRAAWAE